MLDPRRHAAALAAALIITVPAPAAADEPRLVAQIDDATLLAQSQPPLSEDPPSELSGDAGRDERDDGEDPEPREEPQARERLADTGLDAGLVALLGLGLIASGSGLRVALGRGD